MSPGSGVGFPGPAFHRIERTGPDGFVAPAAGRSGPLVYRGIRRRLVNEMTKRYEEDIEVTVATWNGGGPTAFKWRGRLYAVDQSLAVWREAGEWWTEGRGRDREYHRILARPAADMATGDVDADGFMISAGAVYDLYHDRARAGWRLARVWD